MVVPKAGYLARSVISKSITHGYIQSVVAASQSSYAAHHNNFGHLGARLGKSQNLHSQHAFVDRNQHVSASNKQQQESSLAACITAWQSQQGLGQKWEQFQFAKRIEWKPQTLLAESKGKEEVKDAGKEASTGEDEKHVAPRLDRSYSTSAVDDFRKAVTPEAAAEALAKVEEAIAERASRAQQDVGPSTLEHSAAEESLEQQATPQSSASTVAYTPQSSFGFEVTPATSVSEVDVYSEHLTRLADLRQYAEIPAVFEGMLHAGIKPTSPSYNALLLAAIHLPKLRHHVVHKALDVYSDMLKRAVLPDRQTYSILIELLSARALEVQASQNVLDDGRARFGGLEETDEFMLKSEAFESRVLAEDDSLDLAVRMFDTAISIHPKGFSERAYRLLVSACAEQGKITDMVRIYQQMESRRIVPRPEMFVNMIHAFASSGDLRSAVECYDEYKALAIADDKGDVAMARKDDEVYAAVIKAYMISNQQEGAERFFNKLMAVAANEEKQLNLRETVALRAYLAQWLKQNQFEDAFNHASEKLAGVARDIGLSAVCIRAADKNSFEIAARAFSQLSAKADVSSPAIAMVAMHIRGGNLDASEPFWNMLERATPRTDFIQLTAMRTVALIGNSQAETALRAQRTMFARIRDTKSASTSLTERIDEAIEVVGTFMMKRGIFLAAPDAMELMWTMVENDGLVPSVASHLLAGLGPEEISQLAWADLQLLAQVQGSMIINGSSVDIAHQARFAHLLQLLTSGSVDGATEKIIEKTLTKLDNPQVWAMWQQYKFPATSAPYVAFAQSVAPASQPSFDDSYDPYASTTDNKGSVAITELLEKSHGRFSSLLNDALARFKNMRRAGRHPRFFTYAKLISAAAKENRIQLGSDILALARQDVPFLPQYRIVRYGWVTILDSMVAACLTTGRRDLAQQYHQELLNMGAAPSANTFGLYITTLKESTKTFDEASEAVKVFLQAKSEGVEPSSFLYNALIGKLGKARRIDDCLFYFQEMRNLGIRPTSVTYGTIVNALCRVSDEKFAEELFEEMESMPNYKPRPAPYHSMMQFFLTTKRDRSKVLNYYERMRARNIQPTTHTYKLLIDTYATLDPIDMGSAEDVLLQIRQHGEVPEAVHYASLVHAKGCVLRDMEGARKLFDSVLTQSEIRLQPCLFQALFESMVANNAIEQSEPILTLMRQRHIEVTPYIANALIHGWANAKNLEKAEHAYNAVRLDKREPSTYEAMTRAYIALEEREKAMAVVNEALSRGYPAAVANKISDLVGHAKVDAE
jgi:pentatricopeptide repeat protein